MITLCQFPSQWKDVPNASPFSLQVETYLRMTHLAYEVRYVLDPRQGPKGRLPYIVDQDRTVGDATYIIEYLKRRYGDTLDGRLTREQIYQLVRLQKILDGSLMWVMIYSRWIDERGWHQIEQDLAKHLPAGIRLVIPRLMRTRVRKSLEEHGVGSQSAASIYMQGCRNLDSLAEMLGGRPYFLGESPSSIDASAFSILANILYVPIESELKHGLARHTNLQHYCERMLSRFY